jgi:CDP-diacylglycerol---serine O-phosphatidyltransferase
LNVRANIPNAITCGNLFCGCLALVSAFNNQLQVAAYFVGLAAVLDFFDGFAARMLKANSAIGKDLDSLADMVTFGVVPGAVMFKLISYCGSYYTDSIGGSPYLPYCGFLITIFSAIRLAKFNNDLRQTESFIGVPTPATAIFVCSLPLAYDFSSFFNSDTSALAGHFLMNPVNLSILAGILSLLMITEFELFSLKFKTFGPRENLLRYVFLAGCILMLITMKMKALPLVIVFYVLLSFVDNIFLKKKV